MHIFKSLLKTTRLSFQSCYYRSAQKAKRDLYQILGVSKTADPKQIKKAYYKLAQELHPDKNPSPEAKQKFTQVNNAYQTLSDPSKRQMYDQTGHTGQGHAADYGNMGQGFNPQDIFGNFKNFKQGGQTRGFQDLFSDMFGGQFGSRSSRNQDNEPSLLNLVLNFQQSVKGCTKNIEFQKRCTCSTCNGTRAKPGTQPQKCRNCDGTGSQTLRQGMFVMKTTCQACGGQGQKIKHHCISCAGSGIQKQKVKQQVNIPRGISDGVTIKMSGKGNLNGDLFIKVNVRKHSNFVRQGNNVVSELPISIVDAVLGGQKQITTIQGTKKHVAIPKGAHHGDKVVLKNEGFYLLNSSSKGDHIFVVKINIPKSLTNEQQAVFEHLRTLLK